MHMHIVNRFMSKVNPSSWKFYRTLAMHFILYCLTHVDLMMPKSMVMVCHLSVPNHYLNHWSRINNWTLKKRLDGNFNNNSIIFIHRISWHFMCYNRLSSLIPGRCVSNFKIEFSNSFFELISWMLTLKLLLGECQKTPLIISQHWF